MIVFDFRSFCSSFKNIFRSMNRSPAPIPMFNISTITFNRLYSIARRNSHGQSCPRFVSNRWSTNSTVKRLRKMKRVLELPDPCFEGVSYVFSSHRAWRIATYCLSNDLFEFSPPVTSHRIVVYQRQDCTRRSIPISIYIVRLTSQTRFFEWIQ